MYEDKLYDKMCAMETALIERELAKDGAPNEIESLSTTFKKLTGYDLSEIPFCERATNADYIRTKKHILQLQAENAAWIEIHCESQQKKYDAAKNEYVVFESMLKRMKLDNKFTEDGDLKKEVE